MPEALRLPRALAAELLRLAQASPDEEICGLVSGSGGRATRLFPIANVAPDRTRFFALDPRSQIDAMRAMRETGEVLTAIYHSHPHGPAAPSRDDIEQHAYPDALCLIVTPDPPGVWAFRLVDGEVEQVAIGTK